MRVTVLGCAGSYPGPSSPASSYLVEVDDEAGRPFRVLLDAGNGSLGALQRHLDPRELDAVLLSHLHPDHCLDLTSLNVFLTHHPEAPRATRLPVYAPVGAAQRLARAYDPTAPGGGDESEAPDEPPEELGAYEFHVWAPDESVRLGPLTITPVPVWHTVEAYGIRIACDSSSSVLAYTGDTDDCPALDRLARQATVLISEAAFQEGRDLARGIHLTGRRAGQVAARNDVATLLLTHVPAWNDPRATLAEARGVFDGPIVLAAPDVVLDFG